MSTGARLRLIFEAYFASPSSQRQVQLSVLYLLRRDAAQLFGFNPNTYDVRENPRPSLYRESALWPAAMVVFSGIDLLAKFDASTDEEQMPSGTQENNAWRFSSNRRFQTFISRYMNLDQDEAEMIFQLRNALMHSFSLFARRRRGNGGTFNFVLAQRNGSRLLQWREVGRQRDCIVYLFELHRRFERAVIDYTSIYEERLLSSSAERRIFGELLTRYGFIDVGPPQQFGW